MGRVKLAMNIISHGPVLRQVGTTWEVQSLYTFDFNQQDGYNNSNMLLFNPLKGMEHIVNNTNLLVRGGYSRILDAFNCAKPISMDIIK